MLTSSRELVRIRYSFLYFRKSQPTYFYYFFVNWYKYQILENYFDFFSSGISNTHLLAAFKSLSPV